MLNTMNVVGRVTRVTKKEIVVNDKTSVVYNFGIAADDGFGENKKTIFYNAVLYSNKGKQEEFMDQMIAVGNKLPFSGYMTTGKSYTDKNTGYEVTPWIFKVRNLDLGLNKVVLSGRLTSDAVVSSVNTAEGEKLVARFTLAVDRYSNGVDYIRCVKWAKKGTDKIFDYLKQGKKVAVCGRETTDSYTNKEGRKVYTQEISVSEIELYGPKDTPAANNITGMQYQEDVPNDGFIDIPEDEELPFSV